MDYSYKKEMTKTHLARLIVGVFLAGIAVAVAYGIFWYVTLPTIPDDYKTVFADALIDANPSVMETIPPAFTLPDKTEGDAQKLFGASRMSAVFDFGNRTSGYLAKILDSESPEFEPYKSIAGYFLLHSFYDSGGSVTFMANAVESSKFMDDITKRAATVFPGLFSIPLEKMTYPEKSLYFASYLIAMSDRNDSVAIPGNASLELSRAYLQMKKYPESSLYKIVSVANVEDKLHNQFAIVLDRLENRKQSNYSGQADLEYASYDTLAGLNLTSVAIDSLRQFGVAGAFPEVESIDTGANFANSYGISKENATSLFRFTNYLYVRHMAVFSEETPENKAKIEELVKNMVGVSPYQNVTEYSWIIKTMKKVSNSDGIYGFYTVKDISSIAKRSENFREYLNTKGYSYILGSPSSP
ncbi:MAG: hypothetical protein WC835_02010 [Candidatus Paceibacterota bacterium]|jgi:hypothetical protein